MYTENLVMFTQEIMYGESTTSFSNFKALPKHRKNAGLFIHCGKVAKSTQTIAISLLFFAKMQIFTQKMEESTSTLGNFQPSQNKTMKFFLFIMAIWSFFLHFLLTSCIVGVCFWPMKLQKTIILPIDLNLNPLAWSVVMQLTTCVELKRKFFQPVETL